MLLQPTCYKFVLNGGSLLPCTVRLFHPSMTFSPELVALARYLAGEFDNQAQAFAEPAWYVHLRLWQRPVPANLFSEDSITLFAEQANFMTLDRPYRQRVLQLQSVGSGSQTQLQVRYYMLKDPAAFRGACRNRDLLSRLTPAELEFLPGCTLTVTQQPLAAGAYHFKAFLPADARCCFTYQGETRQVSLGFEATPTQLLTYDKGIDPVTGQALWGAILGPFDFTKSQDFSDELTL